MVMPQYCNITPHKDIDDNYGKNERKLSLFTIQCNHKVFPWFCNVYFSDFRWNRKSCFALDAGPWMVQPAADLSFQPCLALIPLLSTSSFLTKNFISMETFHFCRNGSFLSKCLISIEMFPFCKQISFLLKCFIFVKMFNFCWNFHFCRNV